MTAAVRTKMICTSVLVVKTLLNRAMMLPEEIRERCCFTELSAVQLDHVEQDTKGDFRAPLIEPRPFRGTLVGDGAAGRLAHQAGIFRERPGAMPRRPLLPGEPAAFEF